MKIDFWKSNFAIRFIATNDKPITEDDAIDAQISEGYMPQGYGFYHFKSSQQTDGTFKATWECGASAD